eukprot:1903826-Prymnesium_polylepis.1
MHILWPLDAHPLAVGCTSFGCWMHILWPLDAHPLAVGCTRLAVGCTSFGMLNAHPLAVGCTSFGVEQLGCPTPPLVRPVCSSKDGIVSALVLWFDLILDEEIVVST